MEGNWSSADKSDFILHTIADKDVKNEIGVFVHTHDIDLLALIYRDHGIFKRLFAPGIRKRLIRDLTIPLLVLK